MEARAKAVMTRLTLEAIQRDLERNARHAQSIGFGFLAAKLAEEAIRTKQLVEQLRRGEVAEPDALEMK